jgi:argininosuccinate lyase
VLTVEGSLASRDAKGGTAPTRVAEQRERLEAAVARAREWSGRALVVR